MQIIQEIALDWLAGLRGYKIASGLHRMRSGEAARKESVG